MYASTSMAETDGELFYTKKSTKMQQLRLIASINVWSNLK